jgi:aminobenzoyl-glutamate utilization protein B
MILILQRLYTLKEEYSMRTLLTVIAIMMFTNLTSSTVYAADNKELAKLKAKAIEHVEANKKLTQEIVDTIFSFSELGFQEFETQAYLGKILQENGFKFETGVAGIPSAWWASWGSGKPVIALGTDVDGLPKTNQKPGVAYRDELVPGGPGHGEGHNSGQGVNITAALALKAIMEQENIKGTIVIWPGIAEELLATKAYYARDGLFDDVDIVLFSHVSSNLGVTWGTGRGTGLISVEYTFTGSSSHGAGSPWLGRSALDAVELMNTGWNFRREHLHPLQRSHYVISDGGDQPNVVPPTASVWYFVREMTAANIRENFEKLNKTADGAALMTDTSVSRRIIGSAWPRNPSKIVAEAVYENIKQVGLPKWDKKDHAMAKAVQKLVGSEEKGLAMELDELKGPPAEPQSGGSDDIGDVSWNVPTITLRYPSNIGGAIFHHWSSTIAMATPIAHKGATAGAKVMAMSALDFFMQPKLVKDAWTYFEKEQLKDIKYEAFVSADDKPAIEKNTGIMAEFRPQLQKYYYDPSKYDTYLEQLDIEYPTLSE